MSDQKIVEKILWCLPVKFDHVVATMKEFKDLNSYSLIELRSSLQARKKRINRSLKKNVEIAHEAKLGISSNKAPKL